MPRRSKPKPKLFVEKYLSQHGPLEIEGDFVRFQFSDGFHVDVSVTPDNRGVEVRTSHAMRITPHVANSISVEKLT